MAAKGVRNIDSMKDCLFKTFGDMQTGFLNSKALLTICSKFSLSIMVCPGAVT